MVYLVFEAKVSKLVGQLLSVKYCNLGFVNKYVCNLKSITQANQKFLSYMVKAI